jgi:hypothetical protein
MRPVSPHRRPSAFLGPVGCRNPSRRKDRRAPWTGRLNGHPPRPINESGSRPGAYLRQTPQTLCLQKPGDIRKFGPGGLGPDLVNAQLSRCANFFDRAALSQKSSNADGSGSLAKAAALLWTLCRVTPSMISAADRPRSSSSTARVLRNVRAFDAALSCWRRRWCCQ